MTKAQVKTSAKQSASDHAGSAVPTLISLKFSLNQTPERQLYYGHLVLGTPSKSKWREAANLLNTPTKGVERFPSRFAPKQPTTPGKVDVTKPEDQTKTFSTPTRKTPFKKITAKKDAFERLAGEKGPKSGGSKNGKPREAKEAHTGDRGDCETWCNSQFLDVSAQ